MLRQNICCPSQPCKNNTNTIQYKLPLGALVNYLQIKVFAQSMTSRLSFPSTTPFKKLCWEPGPASPSPALVLHSSEHWSSRAESRWLTVSALCSMKAENWVIRPMLQPYRWVCRFIFLLSYTSDLNAWHVHYGWMIPLKKEVGTPYYIYSISIYISIYKYIYIYIICVLVLLATFLYIWHKTPFLRLNSKCCVFYLYTMLSHILLKLSNTF